MFLSQLIIIIYAYCYDYFGVCLFSRLFWS